jgi:vancomycin resistance protein VanJ
MRRIDWTALGWLYIMGIGVWFVLRVWLFDGLWWLAVLNTVAFYLFVPLGILMPLALIARRWQLAVGLLLPVALLLGLFGPAVLPPNTPSPNPTTDIRVMTFNILGCNQRCDAIAQLIQAERPDIVGMQELNAASARVLSERLAAQYPHQALPQTTGVNGMGLFSRFPLREVESVALPPLNLAIRATVDLAAQPVTVLVVHLTPNLLFHTPVREWPAYAQANYAQRKAEIARLSAIVQAEQRPLLLLCDCNLSDTSEAYHTLRAVLQDTFADAGWGLGHTVLLGGLPIPLQRLDYIWRSRSWLAIAARVGDSAGGSDHRPVIAMVRLE